MLMFTLRDRRVWQKQPGPNHTTDCIIYIHCTRVSFKLNHQKSDLVLSCVSHTLFNDAHKNDFVNKLLHDPTRPHSTCFCNCWCDLHATGINLSIYRYLNLFMLIVVKLVSLKFIPIKDMCRECTLQLSSPLHHQTNSLV